MIRKKVIEGLELKDSEFSCSDTIKTKIAQHKGMWLYGEKKDKAGFDLPLIQPILSQHVMFSGGIGSGKTNAINQVVDQLIQLIESRKTAAGGKSDDVVIIFDSKGDFLNKFGPKINDKVVISNDSSATVTWNMFNEALIDYKKYGPRMLDESLMELASGLFQTIIDKDSTNPFFPLAAKNIFYGLLKLLAIKDLNEHLNGKKMKINNKSIYELSKLNSEAIAARFNEVSGVEKDDLLQLIYYLGRMKKDQTGNTVLTENDQGASVIATMRNVLIDIFKGKFAESGNFSIREFIRNKGGRFLFVEYDLNQGRVLDPIYKVLFDLAIKESLCRDRSLGNVFFIIDEFRLLPKLNFMDSGVNLGRGLGAKFIIGIQNLKQIEAIYGEAEAKSILSAFVTNINFRTTDIETREYIKSLSGEQIYEYDVASLSGGKQRDRSSVITDEDILKLDVGEAIINIPVLDKNPIRFKFREFKG